MKEKLFVLSMDAMVHEDVEYLLHKPNFSKLMAQRAEVERVCTIYPSITYPAHVSILTGCRPGRHGVVSNTAFKTVNDGIDHWHLYSSAVQTEDLFAAAKRAGCTTAAVYWPVTGLNPNIDYLINEYFFPCPDEPVLEGFAKFGASEDALDVVRENMGRYPSSHDKSETVELTNTYDDFINGCACSLIRRIKLNLLLARGGYIDVVPDGSVRGWLAFAQSNGMSGTVYLRDPNDRRLWQEVYSYLRQLATDGVWGFQEVYTQEEVRQRYGMYGNFSFMVETDGYTAFSDGWTEPILNPIDFSDYRLGRATHGYQPEKGPQPVFLGQEMPQAEGRCLYELLI